MFKLVVLCVFFAVAAAEPGALFASPFIAPLTYSSTVVAPATTTITKQASSVVHPSPLIYSSPYYGHFIKKRSAPLLASSYFAPTTYFSSALTTPVIAHSPIVPSTPLWSSPLAYAAPAHFIKKRSASLALASPYLASATYAAPLIPAATTYSYTHAISAVPAAPLVAHAPLAYTHLIKKRSAPLLATSYIAPSSFSHQSRVDVQHSAPLITSYAAAAPLTYTSPFLTHLF